MPSIPRGSSETILLVEDEPAILEIGEIMLNSLGYTVIAANSPSEAIRQAEARDGQVHLLITDVIMPEMNGKELAHRLQMRFPGIRVMFMSGYTAEVIANRGVSDEKLWFIQKPFTIMELAGKVRSALA